MPEPEPGINLTVIAPGSMIVTVLSQGIINEIVLVVCAPPVAVMVYEAVLVPNDVVGVVTVRQLALVSADPHPD